MRNSMFIATMAFFGIYYGICHILDISTDYERNNTLWTAFMVYLAARGIGQALRLRPDVYNKA